MLSESPYIRRHVEAHLVFGPLSRGAPVAAIAASTIAAGFVVGYAYWSGEGFFAYLWEVLEPLAGMLVLASFLRLKRPEHVAATWLGTKILFGSVALGLVFLGAPLSFLQGRADAWPNLLLGLVWLPGVEFIPSVLPRQKYVTAARILLTLPCLHYGISSGQWGW